MKKPLGFILLFYITACSTNTTKWKEQFRDLIVEAYHAAANNGIDHSKPNTYIIRFLHQDYNRLRETAEQVIKKYPNIKPEFIQGRINSCLEFQLIRPYPTYEEFEGQVFSVYDIIAAEWSTDYELRIEISSDPASEADSTHTHDCDSTHVH